MYGGFLLRSPQCVGYTLRLNLFGFSALVPVFHYIVVVYVTALIVYFALRFTVGERVVLVAVGNIFLHYALLAAPVLLIGALLLRSTWHSAVLMTITALFAVLYGRRFLPQRNKSHLEKHPVLRVMSYNTAAHYISSQDLIAQIHASSADVVALIELDGTNRDTIQAALQEHYPYQIYKGRGISGKAILSRYPIVYNEYFQLKTERQNLYAQIDVNGQFVHVYALHPPSPNFHRELNFYRPHPHNDAEITMLLRRVNTSFPTLLLGDFNTTEHTTTYHKIRSAGFVDSYRVGGYGFGSTFFVEWKFQVPIIRIDYIWHSAHFDTLHAYVGDPMTSDHAPLVAELALK